MWCWFALAACGPEVAPPGACEPNAATNGIEACNGIDDDCDQQIDEGPSGAALRQSCLTTCGAGFQECANGVWGACSAQTSAIETCNGKDDDCDDEIDEGCACVHGTTESCGRNVGACRTGIRQCIEGQWSNECFGEVGPGVEVCNNGIDDNCDERIDEDCECMPGETLACGSDEGACMAGQIVCNAQSRWGTTCEGEIAPARELCNGLDDDCDGAVDWIERAEFGWRSDSFESNNSCGAARRFGPAIDGETWISLPVTDPSDLLTYPTLHPLGDEDWYTVRAEETSRTCVPGFEQCAFVLQVQLELSDPEAREDFELCVGVTSDCNALSPMTFFCSEGRWLPQANSYAMRLKWPGTCGSNDSREVKIRVRSPRTPQLCGYYQLHVLFGLDPEEPCP